MNFKAAIAVLGLSLCWASAAEARGSVPIIAHDNVLLAAGPLTTDQVRSAILRAAARTGYPWTVTAGGPDSLVATTIVRGKHTAEVTITYTRTSITVAYRDSKNLNYRVRKGVAEIHPNYNKWVQELIDAIQTEASRK